MKRIIVALLALSLAGCADGPSLEDLKNAVKVATTTIENPLDDVDIYRVKNTYAIALELSDQYRTYCWSAPFKALMGDAAAGPLCRSRREVVRSFQAAQIKAKKAIRAAEKFITMNPTISASTVVRAAWQAVSEYKNSVPAAE